MSDLPKMTFAEFQKSRKKVDKKYIDELGYDTTDMRGLHAFVYVDAGIIEILNDDLYYLLIDRSEYESDDLHNLELMLYHWCIDEILVPKNRVEFNIISPDGFATWREPFVTDKAVYEECAALQMKWFIHRFDRQGYYSSNNGRIPLEELEAHCRIEVVSE